jgi:hypothetical protein
MEYVLMRLNVTFINLDEPKARAAPACSQLSGGCLEILAVVAGCWSGVNVHSCLNLKI